MSTIVPEDFAVENSDAAIGAQAKKKKKKRANKKKNAANAADPDDERFGYRLSDIPQVHYRINRDLTGQRENEIFIYQGPAPVAMGQDTTQRPDQVFCHTLDGDLVVRDLLENQYVYLDKLRPDLIWSPEQRPKPSVRYGKLLPGEPKQNEYQTISTINFHSGKFWRPGNTLRDASPTEGLFIDTQIVELVTRIKAELDVPHSSLTGLAPKLREKSQVKQEVRKTISLH